MKHILYQLAQLSSDALPKPDLEASITEILRLVFMGITLISVIFVALGGFKYTTSNGDPQSIAKAKDTILYSLVGLVLSVSVVLIIEFVASRL